MVDFQNRQGQWAASYYYEGEKVFTRLGLIYRNVMSRCKPNSGQQKKYPTYVGCSSEFLDFQDFACWAVLQIGYGSTGAHLDKDILCKGNKAYAKRFCAFVPHQINTLLTKANANRGDCPIGVSCVTAGKFSAKLQCGARRLVLGTFTNPEDAFQAYKLAKEARIKEAAQRHKEVIDPRVFDALLAYQVEITD